MPVTSGINFVATLPYVNRNFESHFMGSGLWATISYTNLRLEMLSPIPCVTGRLDGVNQRFVVLLLKLGGKFIFVNGHEREHYDDQNTGMKKTRNRGTCRHIMESIKE